MKKREATKEMMQEALEYYRENSYGFSSVKQYVKIDFGHFLDEKEQAKIVRYIKSNI